MAENVLSRVNISGSMRQSPLYATLGIGLTDPIILIGHADGLNINDPYQVVNIQEAINKMGADGFSPLLRTLLEVYNIGCRDIWIVAAGPMSEYVSDLSARFTKQFDGNTKNFYEKYYSRLTNVYNIIRDFEQLNIIVPVEAPFYYTGNVDFLTQLANHCDDAFANTGVVRMGFLGSRIVNRSAADITAMANDPRTAALGDKGKFVVLILGEGLTNLPQLQLSYNGSLATQAAAMLAVQDLYKGLTYSRFGYVISIAGPDLTNDQIQRLCSNRVNPVIKTPRARRGASFQCVLASDNTCAPTVMQQDGSLLISTYWSAFTMRLLYTCASRIYYIGKAYIGSGANFLPAFRKDVEDYLKQLITMEAIDNYQVDFFRAQGSTDVQVNLVLYPKMGIRTILFQVEVGPGI